MIKKLKASINFIINKVRGLGKREEYTYSRTYSRKLSEEEKQGFAEILKKFEEINKSISEFHSITSKNDEKKT